MQSQGSSNKPQGMALELVYRARLKSVQIKGGPGWDHRQAPPGPGWAGKRPKIDDLRPYNPPKKLKTSFDCTGVSKSRGATAAERRSTGPCARASRRGKAMPKTRCRRRCRMPITSAPIRLLVVFGWRTVTVESVPILVFRGKHKQATHLERSCSSQLPSRSGNSR